MTTRAKVRTSTSAAPPFRSARVTALGEVLSVTKATHEFGPSLCDTREVPARLIQRRGEAEAGDAGHDDMKRIFGVSTKRAWIAQRLDDIEELYD